MLDLLKFVAGKRGQKGDNSFLKYPGQREELGMLNLICFRDFVTSCL